MNKIILEMLALVLVAVSVQAQHADTYTAAKGLDAFNLDQSNKKKLREAVEAILPDPWGEDVEDPRFYILRGKILSELAGQIVVVRQTGLGSLEELPQVDMVAVKAFKSFATAVEKHAQAINSPRYNLRDALNGIREAQGNLYNLGIYAFEAQDFGSAYINFSLIFASHEILKKEGGESILDNADAMMDQKYITGLAALNNNMNDLAWPLFEDLYMANYDNAAIYEAMYIIKSNDEEVDMELAYQYLKTGREKYPEDVSLLFTEINHFLKINRLDELIDKLGMAIKSEPNNLTLYNTIGSVYDNLYQREFKSGDMDSASNYFEQALNYYNQTLEKDPNNFDALYSTGALYYNHAANMTVELNEMSEDFSMAGIENSEAMEAEVFSVFDKALPYFQNAERVNPNSVPTLIALKEIYARNNETETSNAFEERLANVQGGGINETPFFNE